MKAREVMTANPVCCTPQTRLQDVSRLMVEADCGEIPVVENESTRKPVGVITDRDIVCRTVAEGKNPLEMTAGQCMSQPAVTVTPEATVEDCCKTMEENQIRRLPVVDEQGGCCGMVSQADIALHADQSEVSEVVRDVSRPTREASRASGCC